MIAVGVWVESPERYRSAAAIGIARIMEPDTVVLESETDGCAFEAFGEIIAAARELPDLEGLILLRDDAEVLDGALFHALRALLALPDAGLVGVAGARHVDSLRWWEAETVGRLTHAGGVVGTHVGGSADAHVLDGGLIALAPAAVQALGFAGSGWRGRHGHAAELCALARVADLGVVVTDVPVRRHEDAIPAEDAAFIAADGAWRWRWSGIAA